MQDPSSYVQPIHFEDFDGTQFERLVFAYHARTQKWQSLEWYGQTGTDLGRDIWGIQEDGQTICIQCANRAKLTFAKIRGDLAKVLSSANGAPSCFRTVARCGTISARMRDKLKTHCIALGVHKCDVWSGREFEEFLRNGAECLLKRFVEGKAFPDTAQELQRIALDENALSDDEIIAAMAKLFDRPAFYTPILQESNLGDFKQAITDTIQGLGTGIWKARDGNVIGRIPSRHQIKDPAISQKLQSIEAALAKLRAEFDSQLRNGAIRHCGCSVPDCPTYFIAPHAAHRLEQLREDVLRQFQGVYQAGHLRSRF